MIAMLTRRRRINWFPALVVVWSVLFFQETLFRATTLDLRSVWVADVEEPLHLPSTAIIVDRDVKRQVSLRWRITVVEAESEVQVCTVSSTGSTPYSPKSSGSLTRSLGWWFGGRAAIENCRELGLESGTFYLHTCHWTWYGLGACTNSNVFRIGRGL